MGLLKRMMTRLRQDESQTREANLKTWASSQEGVTLIAESVARSVVRIAGSVQALRVRPREGVPAIEAVVTDGSGTCTAVWLGRRSIPGLTLGVRMFLEGRLGGTPGDLQIVNPRYEFAEGRTLD